MGYGGWCLCPVARACPCPAVSHVAAVTQISSANGARQATTGQNRPKMTQRGPEPPCGPCPRGQTHLRWQMTCQSNVLDHGRPDMGRATGRQGPFWAVLPTLNSISGSLCAKTMIWPYLGLCGSNRKSEGTFPRCNPPPPPCTVCGLHPSEWPKRTPGRVF